MPDKLNAHQLGLLSSIAEHRILLTSQLAHLHNRHVRTTRRAVTTLEEMGLVQASFHARGSGHPEKLLSLTAAGVEALRDHDLVDLELPADCVTAETIHCVNHQLLLNWFRIHLVDLERHWPKFTVRFLSSTSPFLPRDPSGRQLTYQQIDVAGNRQGPTGFLPDTVFSITHATRHMTLLFFLEVDMGTEPLASSVRAGRDIRGKILNYQRCFRRGRYKRYEEVFGAALRGFRLLFLAHNSARLQSLCRQVREMPPSGFIWLTEEARMSSQGAHATVWAPGGRLDAPPESILGSEMPNTPGQDSFQKGASADL